MFFCFFFCPVGNKNSSLFQCWEFYSYAPTNVKLLVGGGGGGKA